MGSVSSDYRHVQFLAGHDHLDFDQLQILFQQTAFWARKREKSDLEIAIKNSNPVVTVWDGNLLMGFARATSDGIYRATIWDVVIHPHYQGGGLGRKLVQTVLSHPMICQVERIYLMTTYQQNFYERIGFQHNESTTMILQNQPFEQLSISPNSIEKTTEKTIEIRA